MYLLCLFVVLTALFITVVNSQSTKMPLEGHPFNHFPSHTSDPKEISDNEKVEEKP